MLLQGCLGMAVCLLFLALQCESDIQEIQLVLMFLFIAFFETSVGPVTWVYASEVLPDRGVSLVLLVNWTFTIAVGFTYPYMSDKSALGIAGSFWVYCGLCVAAGLFVFGFVVETKGMSRKEILARLEKGPFRN